MISIREISDLGVLQSWDRDPYDVRWEPRLYASSLPFYSGTIEGDVTSPDLLGKRKNSECCLRKVILGAAGIDSSEIYSIADVRNFERGDLMEWHENRLLLKGLKDKKFKDWTIIGRIGYDDKPPQELTLPVSKEYGIPITGRCDMRFRNKITNEEITVEMKCPKSGSYKYSDGKPRASYAVQAGHYLKMLNHPVKIYMNSGGDACFGEWNLKFEDNNYLYLYNAYGSDVLLFNWNRVEQAIKNITPMIYDFYNKYYGQETTEEVLSDILKFPGVNFCTEFPCSWEKGTSRCPYYSHCWERNYKLKYKGNPLKTKEEKKQCKKPNIFNSIISAILPRKNV